MRITACELPVHSMLHKPGLSAHYSDSFQGSFTDRASLITAADAGKAFFSSAPGWVQELLALRNRIVSPFGLKTPGRLSDLEKRRAAFRCQPGEQLGLFTVFAATEKEVILGENDKHLDFRVSLLLEDTAAATDNRRLTITTTVRFNNRFGRMYFIPVRPFHRIIVPVMLKGILRQLEAKAAASASVKATT